MRTFDKKIFIRDIYYFFILLLNILIKLMQKIFIFYLIDIKDLRFYNLPLRLKKRLKIKDKVCSDNIVNSKI